MSDLESLVERYVDCYNNVDIDGMLDCVTDDVRFENISNAGQSMQLQGKDAIAQVAAASAQAFTYRRQRLISLPSTCQTAPCRASPSTSKAQASSRHAMAFSAKSSIIPDTDVSSQPELLLICCIY